MVKCRLSERKAKEYATYLWTFAVSKKYQQLKKVIVDKIASGLSADTYERIASWPADLTQRLAHKLIHQGFHNDTDLEGLVDITLCYEEATTASDIEIA